MKTLFDLLTREALRDFDYYYDPETCKLEPTGTQTQLRGLIDMLDGDYTYIHGNRNARETWNISMSGKDLAKAKAADELAREGFALLDVYKFKMLIRELSSDELKRARGIVGRILGAIEAEALAKYRTHY